MGLVHDSGGRAADRDHGPPGQHSHEHAPRDFGPAFALAIALNAGYVALEAGVGLYVGALALLADAAHNLIDVGGLLLAWGAHHLAKKSPRVRYTYGYGRATILAAMLNGLVLMIAVGALAWEAIARFSEPEPVPGFSVLWVAALGTVVNAGTALLFLRGSDSDLNIRGAYLHMAADAAVSLGVVASALLIIRTGYAWIDPAAALAVCAIIAWSSFGLLKRSVHLELDGVPYGVDRDAVVRFLAGRAGVASVHDLHIWALSTTTTAMTAHLVMPDGHPGDAFLRDLSHDIEHEFGIGHVTVQIERGDGDVCRLAAENVI